MLEEGDENQEVAEIRPNYVPLYLRLKKDRGSLTDNIKKMLVKLSSKHKNVRGVRFFDIKTHYMYLN